MTLLSQTLLEECLSHVTHYNEACRGSGVGGKGWHATDPSPAPTEGSVESCVFASLPSDDPWSAVCQQPEAQQGAWLWLLLSLPPPSLDDLLPSSLSG